MTMPAGDPGPIGVERDEREVPESDVATREEDDRKEKRGKDRHKDDRDQSGERNVGG